MKYSCARTSTSTKDQKIASRRAAIKSARCSPVYDDKRLTGEHAKCTAIARYFRTLRSGNSLIVRLAGLSRSLRDLIMMLDDLRASAVKFHSFTEAIDTETPMVRAMWQLIGVWAGIERSLISECARAGVTAAKRGGVKFCRRTDTHIRADRPRQRVDRKGRIPVYDADLLNVITRRYTGYWRRLAA